MYLVVIRHEKFHEVIYSLLPSIVKISLKCSKYFPKFKKKSHKIFQYFTCSVIKFDSPKSKKKITLSFKRELQNYKETRLELVCLCSKPILPFICCASLGKSLKLSVPYLFHLLYWNNSSYLINC